MFKRSIVFLLVFSMLFSFCSCGEKQDTPITPPETTNQISTVKVAVPEGYTLVRIAWLLEEKGLCTADDFIEACQTYDQWLDLTKYPFLADLQKAENVCFKLEGYLFPLTYDIPEGSTAKEIVEIFLTATGKKFNSEFLKQLEGKDYNLHEILSIASIIEKEAALDEQRADISSVIHNRLDIGMKIQCDPTVKYCDGVINLIYPEELDHYKYYYSTYLCSGLIAGPICNPGMKSIEAAIYPNDTEYLFFIIGTVPPYESKFSKTYEEHQKFWKENKDRLTGN
jgi:UPF0755 protein